MTQNEIVTALARKVDRLFALGARHGEVYSALLLVAARIATAARMAPESFARDAGEAFAMLAMTGASGDAPTQQNAPSERTARQIAPGPPQ